MSLLAVRASAGDRRPAGRLAVVGLLALAAPALGQSEASSTGTVVGLVYDSTASAPLAGATVALMGTDQVGESGEDGQFRLDSVPAGEYDVAFFHPRLGVFGVNGSPQRVIVSAGRTSDAYLAIPSRETIMDVWCSAEPGDGPVVSVGGVVSDALTGVPLPGRWSRCWASGGARCGRGRTLAETRTESDGGYLICNLPAAAGMLLQVEFGTSENLPRQIAAAGTQALDLSIPISEPVTITGSVLDHASRKPLQGARIQLLGSDFSTLADSVGRFGFSGVPPGRQTIETSQLGYATRVDSLTVFSNEALGLEITLSTQAIALEPIVVTGSRNENVFTTTGIRFVGLTEAQIDSIAPRVTDMAGLVRQVRVPGLLIRETYMPNAFGQPQMGVCIELTRQRTATTPNTCNMVDVRINEGPVPEPAFFLLELDPRSIRRIQLISPMEASILYGDRAANGVLLIYTR